MPGAHVERAAMEDIDVLSGKHYKKLIHVRVSYLVAPWPRIESPFNLYKVVPSKRAAARDAIQRASEQPSNDGR